MGVVSRLPQNLLAWNEALNTNPPWNPQRIDPPVATVAPNGENTAFHLHEDATAANTHLLNQTVVPVQYGLIYTISTYARAVNRDWVLLYAAIAGNDASLFFNVNTGAVGAMSAAVIASGIDLRATGWYRIWLSFLSQANENAVYRNYIAEADTDITFDGLDQDSIDVWHPQANTGIGPDDDVATQEVPRTPI